MMKILVADDDVTMLGLLKTLLELEGDQAVTVTRPEDIIPAAVEEAPSLILMDYYLAGGDVMETLLKLKSTDGLKEIPVLVASGMDREVACLKAGAEGFILKPFRPTQLLDRIRTIASGG